MTLRNCYVNKTRNDKITVSSIVTFRFWVIGDDYQNEIFFNTK